MSSLTLSLPSLSFQARYSTRVDNDESKSIYHQADLQRHESQLRGVAIGQEKTTRRISNYETGRERTMLPTDPSSNPNEDLKIFKFHFLLRSYLWLFSFLTTC